MFAGLSSESQKERHKGIALREGVSDGRMQCSEGTAVRKRAFIVIEALSRASGRKTCLEIPA